MKDYLIIITYMHPYPTTLNYTIKASHVGVALARAFKKVREENKGKVLISPSENRFKPDFKISVTKL